MAIMNNDIDESFPLPPNDFLCPLTLEIFRDPLMSKHGHSFERQAILQWLEEGNQDCPLTRKPLTPSMLFPNVGLRLKVRTWQLDNNMEVSCHGPLDESDACVSGDKLIVCLKPRRNNERITTTSTGIGSQYLRNQGQREVTHNSGWRRQVL